MLVIKIIIFFIIKQMTPVNLVRQHSLELQQFGNECIDDSLSMDTQDIIDQPAFSITEIAVSINYSCSFFVLFYNVISQIEVTTVFFFYSFFYKKKR